mgnify:CR=1 FL=1
MDFLTDTDTDMDPGWLNYAELDDVRRVRAAWDDYQEVFDQLEDFEVASLNDETPALRKLDWSLPS